MNLSHFYFDTQIFQSVFAALMDLTDDRTDQIKGIMSMIQDLKSGSSWHLPEEIYQQIAMERRTPIIKFMSNLCRDFLNAYENFDYDIKVNGELRVLKVLEVGFDTSPHIFDVGANKGDWSLTAANCFPNATIHAFEIVPQTYQKLSENILRKKSIIGNNFGLSDFDGVLDIRYYPDDTGLSGFTEHVHDKPFELIRGRVVTGDFYMEKLGISNIDLLKLDVEGGEHKVLKGFSKAIDRQLIDVIQFEYGKVNITTKFLLADYYQWLGSKGYSIGKIYPDHVAFKEYEYTDENFLGPNFLAVRKSRKELISKLS